MQKNEQPHLSAAALDRFRRKAMHFSGIGYYGLRLDGTVLFMDQTAFKLLDLEHRFATPEAATGQPFTYLVRDRDLTELLAYLKQHACLRGNEWCLTTAQEEERWLYEDARMVAPAEDIALVNDESWIEIVVRDITMRKHKEAVYRTDQHKYQRILETIHEGYYETDIEGRLTFFTRALANLFGESEEDLLGCAPTELFNDENLKRSLQSAYDSLLKGQPDVLLESRLTRRDGITVVLDLSMTLIKTPEGKPCGFRGLARDITDRANAEHAFRTAEARYKSLFEEANDIIYTHDLEGRITALNKAGEEISGYRREEAYAMCVYDIIAPEYRQQAQGYTLQRLQGQEIGRYELEIIAKDGSRVGLEINAQRIVQNDKAIGIQGIARDVTLRRRTEEQRKRLERQILHTQKLEGLGVLAGGIAHDFNNLLVGILGNASLAMRRLPRTSPVNTYMKRIEKAAQRAADLTNQLLAYSGRGTFLVRPLHLDKLAREIADLARQNIADNIHFVFDFHEATPPILGDVAQIHQVLMNLIVNASEAIGECEGTISLKTETSTLNADDFDKLHFHANAKPGEYVCLTVQDTGCGITEEHKSRIFDPFFSTKFTGRGLGLAALIGIVRGHKGALNVSSEPGRGSVFNLFFPAVRDAKNIVSSTSRYDKADQQHSAFRDWKTSGLVLVADDEEAVRLFAREVLKRLGMTVITAYDGQEAIALYDRHKETLCLAIIDLMMPFVNGQEVLEHIRKTRADLPIVLSSGYTEEEIHERFRDNQPNDFIQKPYRTLDLIRTVKSLLQTPESPIAAKDL